MSIVKMKRLRVIGLEEERDALLQQLLHVGCVEVTEPSDKLADPEWTALLRRESSVLSDVKSQANTVSAALEALQKYAPVKGGLFILRRNIREKDFLNDEKLEAALDCAGEINQRTQRINHLVSQENRLNTQRAALVPWKSLDLPLDTKSTQHVKITLGACPAAVELSELTSAVTQAAPTSELMEVGTDKELHYLLFCCHKSEAEEAARARAELEAAEEALAAAQADKRVTEQELAEKLADLAMAQDAYDRLAKQMGWDVEEAPVKQAAVKTTAKPAAKADTLAQTGDPAAVVAAGMAIAGAAAVVGGAHFRRRRSE